jgi:hypothetical protein
MEITTRTKIIGLSLFVYVILLIILWFTHQIAFFATLVTGLLIGFGILGVIGTKNKISRVENLRDKYNKDGLNSIDRSDMHFIKRTFS